MHGSKSSDNVKGGSGDDNLYSGSGADDQKGGLWSRFDCSRGVDVLDYGHNKETL